MHVTQVREVATDAAQDAPTAPRARPPLFGRRRRRTAKRVRSDLIAMAVVGVLLVGALASAGAVLYQQLYSPTAFVLRYLDLLSQGRAADALAIPGVAIDSAELDAAGLPLDASEALLRPDSLAPLTDISAKETTAVGDGTFSVTVNYVAGSHEGTSTFRVEPAGWLGVAPTWRFAQSPLAVINLTVQGSMEFSVNEMSLDKRQVSVNGVAADPAASVPMLVFSPGFYSVSVSTAVATSPGVGVLSDSAQANIPVTVESEPTDEFTDVVQTKVEAFLNECTTQDVLQPTGCPFGTTVKDRVVSAPQWQMVAQPVVALAPNAGGWSIRRTQAIAQVTVDVQNIFDGIVHPQVIEVPFFIEGEIAILPDGTASIQVAAAD